MYGLTEDECGHQMILSFSIHTPASYPSTDIYLTNSFTTSLFCNWHFCHQLQGPSWESTSGWSLSNSSPHGTVRSEGPGESDGRGEANRHSLSAGTLSSPSSCFGTWRLQSYFFPVASFSFHLLQGLPVKFKRHKLKGKPEIQPTSNTLPFISG